MTLVDIKLIKKSDWHHTMLSLKKAYMFGYTEYMNFKKLVNIFSHYGSNPLIWGFSLET
jgi:hypothetical protein